MPIRLRELNYGQLLSAGLVLALPGYPYVQITRGQSREILVHRESMHRILSEKFGTSKINF